MVTPRGDIRLPPMQPPRSRGKVSEPMPVSAGKASPTHGPLPSDGSLKGMDVLASAPRPGSSRAVKLKGLNQAPQLPLTFTRADSGKGGCSVITSTVHR